MLSVDEIKEVETKAEASKSIYVYEAPVRLWHWTTVFCMVILMSTGYLIGEPVLLQPGDGRDKFFFGYVRFAHFAAGYVLAIALLGRIYWAFVGNRHSRQIFTPPIFKTEWWSEVFFELRWYFFLEDRPKKYVGHNPLATVMMFFNFLFVTTFQIFSGFALYSEGTGHGSWQDTLFGWLLPLLGGSLQVHAYHRLGMWALLCFICIHVYAALREDIMSRQSIISTMISGRRYFKD